MRIFRCHHKFGFEHGPFTGDYANGFDLRINPKIHPTPCEDGIHGLGGNFACVSLKAVDIWFGNNIRALVDNGFVVTEFEAPEQYVTVGKQGTQCRFQLGDAVPIRTMFLRDAIKEAHGFTL